MQFKDNVESINEAISKLENCISEASDLMKQNSLKINEDKTEFIIFSTNQRPRTVIHYSYVITVLHYLIL